MVYGTRHNTLVKRPPRRRGMRYGQRGNCMWCCKPFKLERNISDTFEEKIEAMQLTEDGASFDWPGACVHRGCDYERAAATKALEEQQPAD